MDPIYYEDLTWPQLLRLPRERVVIAQPFGAVEQHGPHAPLDTDCNPMRAVLPRAALEARRRGQPVLVGSLIPYGYSAGHVDPGPGPDRLPGTVHLSATTFLALALDIGRSFVRTGFRRLAFVTGHNGNLPLLQDAREATPQKGEEAIARMADPRWRRMQAEPSIVA